MGKKNKFIYSVTSISKQLIMIFMVFAVLLPMYFVFVTAIKSPDEFMFNKWGFPKQPTLMNFQRLAEGETIFRWLLNSLFISIGSVILSVMVASLMAYAFTRFHLPFKPALFIGITSLLILSPVVLVIPLFRTMVSLGLHNTYTAVIIIYVGIMLPISTYLLTNFFKGIPVEIIDAALMDGCNSFQIYFQIMIPLSMPAVITAALTNWLLVWNDILIGLIFLQNDKMRTLMSGLSLFKGKYTTNIPLTMAGVAIAIIPTLIIYIFGQRYFIRGLTEGAVK
jgi:ABC-type glycerol-3-phosphate transport system permease component